MTLFTITIKPKSARAHFAPVTRKFRNRKAYQRTNKFNKLVD